MNFSGHPGEYGFLVKKRGGGGEVIEIFVERGCFELWGKGGEQVGVGSVDDGASDKGFDGLMPV